MNLIRRLRLVGDDSKVSLTAVSVLIALVHVGLSLDSLSFVFLCFSLAFYQIDQLIEQYQSSRSNESLETMQARMQELETKVAEVSLVRAFKGGSYGN